jgi:hypothetical protein
MPYAIEETMLRCKKCKRETVHQKSRHASSWFMILIHIILIIMTAGIWIIFLGMWMLGSKKFAVGS